MTVKQMDTFRDKYLGSEDEKKDIKRIWNTFTSHLMAIWISSQSDIAFDDRTPQLLLQIIRDKECIIWRFCQKESNKCKVTAEEDFVLSIESIWNWNESQF
jgi:lysyl-tRNA synthetase class I